MKNKSIRFSAMLMMLGLFAIASFGQKTERVKFAKGETSGYYTRTLPAQGSIDFIVNAKAGQFMDYTVAYDFNKSDIGAFLTEPNLQDISQTPKIDERNVFPVNTGGDHRITVNNMTRKSVTITLYIQVTNDDPDADNDDDGSMNAGNTGDSEVERIELPKGSVFTDVEITLAPGETKQFVAYVKKGIMVCIEPNKKLGSNVQIGVDAKTLDMSKSATNQACTAKAIESRDQYMYFENNGRTRITFTANIGFYKN